MCFTKAEVYRAVRRLPAFFSALVCVVVLSACVQNPVTGKNDLLLVSESWELQVGAQQYVPLRQQQGGDYTADPQVEAYVRSVGMKLAEKSDRELPYEFNVINDSTPNAWALPGGKISINRGLLVELNSEAELAAVLGHEIVHAAAKHGARGQTRGIGLQLGVVTATILADQNGYNGQIAQLASSVGAQIINSRYGQSAELESDHFGMEYMSRAGYDPQGAVELQRTFLRLSKGRADNPLSRLFASHPPSQKRVDENIKTAAELPRGGVTAERAYKQRLARLFDTTEAYEAHDQAQVALNDGDTRKAASLLAKAIRIEPRESTFYTLQGDIAATQKNFSRALQAYNKAISLNDDYFYNYVQRGKVNEATNNFNAAQSDYAKSLTLLPTATAQLGLGAFAERQGNSVVARRYFSEAAQADGREGDLAKQALIRVQPSAKDSKDNALFIRQGLTRAGTFAIEVVNQTSKPVGNIVLGVKVGNSPQRELGIKKVLQPGGEHRIQTGRKLTREQADKVEVTVLRADAR